ncbi:GNAT family N-acetyltransferase [Parvularcula sp. LCG005]|uniref:GNAT family N-acetyltransferase n=1 Tax=Parvularcula sp. LCG005 TaxID=3078805 RepID=UPI002942AB0E|nr:GNAT family N-acetyltransferase [Parvularcula sp. LCG005]WOI52222.1 GNAT family N-acetyltransferase [Parvularcula sp. LCG005]
MPTERKAPLRIERFDPARHDRAGFSCGVPRLDNFLQLTAKQQQTADMTRVYVAVEDGEDRILGYHTIGMGMMEASLLKKRPRGAPDHGELPVLFLGQVAVDGRAQGQGLGGILMQHVFEKARLVADEAGCFALLLDVMTDGGEESFERRRAWYASFGFEPFPSRPARMFLTLKDVRAILCE